jgi:hypothetical protein
LLTTSGGVNCLKLVIIFLSQLDTIVIYMIKRLGGKLLFKKGGMLGSLYLGLIVGLVFVLGLRACSYWARPVYSLPRYTGEEEVVRLWNIIVTERFFFLKAIFLYYSSSA